MGTTKNPKLTELVEAALEADPDASVQELYTQGQAAYGSDVEKLTQRQFNARYVLPVKQKRTKPRKAAPKKATAKKRAKKDPAPVELGEEPGMPWGDIRQIPIRDLVPWPGLNPRTRFDAAELEELADSIRDQGIRMPVGVKMNDEAPHFIFQGERRYRAAGIAGLEWLPCLVTDIEFREAHSMAMTENMQRASLTPLEEARGLERELKLAEKAGEPLTQEQLGHRYGYGQAWVSNRIRLLTLPEGIQDLLDDGIISATAARDHLMPFLRLTDEKVRRDLFRKIVSTVSAYAEADGQLPIRDDQVQGTVAVLARSASYPLLSKGDHPMHFMYVPGRLTRGYVQAKVHQKECGCGGPSYAYLGYGYATSRSRSSRCFDKAWWEKENERAKRAFEEASDAEWAMAEAAAAAAGGEAELGPEDGPREVVVRKQGEVYRSNDFTLWERENYLRLVFEPFEWGARPSVAVGLLEAERFHLVDLGSGVTSLAWIGPVEDFDLAAGQFWQMAGDALRERRRRRGKASLKIVESRDFGGQELTWLLSDLSAGALKAFHILATLEDLGVDTTALLDGAHHTAEPLHQVLIQLPPAKVLELGKVLALRLQDGAFEGWRSGDPLRREVEDELIAQNLAQLTELLPFPLPGTPAPGAEGTPAGDDPPTRMEDDGEEESDEARSADPHPVPADPGRGDQATGDAPHRRRGGGPLQRGGHPIAGVRRRRGDVRAAARRGAHPGELTRRYPEGCDSGGARSTLGLRRFSWRAPGL